MTTKTRANFKTDKNTALADNTAGDISALDMRGEFDHIADSALFDEDLTGTKDTTTFLRGDKAFVALDADDISDATTENRFVSVAILDAITANTAKVSNVAHTGDVTGSGLLTIGAGKVTLAMLSAAGTRDSTTFYRGDGTFARPGADLTDGTSQTDANGNEIITYGVAASAVNNVKLSNVGTGAAVKIEAVGGDANIDLDLVSKGTGDVTINGSPIGGGIASVAADATPQLGGDLDGQGNEIAHYTNAVVTSVTGTLTIAAHSGNILKTSGNVTVPTTAGFTATIIAGGAHTVTFNATTSAAMATGDIMTVLVESGTVIHAVLTAAADKVSFA